MTAAPKGDAEGGGSERQGQRAERQAAEETGVHDDHRGRNDALLRPLGLAYSQRC